MSSTQSHLNLLEQKLYELLAETRQSLESADKITFGNTHVNNMKQRCHNMNQKIAEALALLGKIKQ